jgi:threonine synthase
MAFQLVCAGCGTPAPAIDVDPYPFRCRSADASRSVDHVITKLSKGTVPIFPEKGTIGDCSPNPFLRYEQLLYSHDVAARLSGAVFKDIVERLDDAIARVAGHGFRITPFCRSAPLSAALGFSSDGGVWVKDETGNVSGSHKGRHLAGIMLYLQVLESAALVKERPELAIASCGNAALAAAVVARAAGWKLRAFIPPDAHGRVVDQLRELAVTLVVCPRRPGEEGDPCYRRFREALAEGALPFCCQGPDNGLTIEGGETIAYEMADQLGTTALDAIVVQVGGGALASSIVQGFERAAALGRITRMPRVYTVQTLGAAPLSRAFDRVAERAGRTSVEEALRHAATHRSEFMWAWKSEPHSIAHGILDDETYDWMAVVRGMLQTGGRAVTVSEERLKSANVQARQTTGINVDHTGSAGVAGLVELVARREIARNENVATIFSGVRR